MGTVDLTEIGDPSFSYKVRVGEEIVEVTLDHDRVAMLMQSQMPTLFKPTGDLVKDGDGDDAKPVKDKEGNTQLEIGIGLVFRCFQEGKPIPAQYPDMLTIVDKLRKIFELPVSPEIGVKHVMAVFSAWATEMKRRSTLKKGTPDSPDSPAPTPAASESKA